MVANDEYLKEYFKQKYNIDIPDDVSQLTDDEKATLRYGKLFCIAFLVFLSERWKRNFPAKRTRLKKMEFSKPWIVWKGEKQETERTKE